jgi:hypothetical protein
MRFIGLAGVGFAGYQSEEAARCVRRSGLKAAFPDPATRCSHSVSRSGQQGVEHRQAPTRPAGDRRRDNAPVPRQGIIACFSGPPAGFGVGITAKIGNERFRFVRNREPQLMRPLR